MENEELNRGQSVGFRGSLTSGVQAWQSKEPMSDEGWGPSLWI